jgi:hypothetical protein
VKLSDIADVLSVLGFVVTLWVAWNVRSLRAFYTLVRILPVRIDRIRELAERIRRLHGQFPNSREEVLVERGRLLATLEPLARQLPHGRRRSVRSTIASIKLYQSGSRTPALLWEIYGQSQNALEELSYYLEERQWQI